MMLPYLLFPEEIPPSAQTNLMIYWKVGKKELVKGGREKFIVIQDKIYGIINKFILDKFRIISALY
jgi:hypothetical protein